MGTSGDFGDRLGEALEKVRNEIREAEEEKHRIEEENRNREGRARELAFRFWQNVITTRLTETARKLPNASVLKEDVSEDQFGSGFTADLQRGQLDLQITVTCRNEYHELLAQSKAFLYPEATGTAKPAGKSVHSGSESFMTAEFDEDAAAKWVEDELIEIASKGIHLHEDYD